MSFQHTLSFSNSLPPGPKMLRARLGFPFPSLVRRGALVLSVGAPCEKLASVWVLSVLFDPGRPGLWSLRGHGMYMYLSSHTCIHTCMCVRAMSSHWHF